MFIKFLKNENTDLTLIFLIIELLPISGDEPLLKRQDCRLITDKIFIYNFHPGLT